MTCFLTLLAWFRNHASAVHAVHLFMDCFLDFCSMVSHSAASIAGRKEVKQELEAQLVEAEARSRARRCVEV